MRIQNNIPALNTFRQLGINNTGSAKALEKLSSGFRINRAGDDAAGLAISEKMRAQIRGLNRASANAQDGISLIQAAEGALQESQNILQRMRYLAVQASNDVNETEDRTYIQDEINQLVKELDRIAFTSEFNKKTLLDGSLQNGSFSAKSISGSGVATGIVVTDKSSVPGIYNISTATIGIQASASFDIGSIITAAEQGEQINLSITSGTNAIENVDGNKKYLSPDEILVTFVATGDVQKDNATAINMLKDVLTKTIGEDYIVTTSGFELIITANKALDAASTSAGGFDSITSISFDFWSEKFDSTTGTMTAGAISTTAINAANTVGGQTAHVTVSGNGANTSVEMSSTQYGEFSVDMTALSAGLRFSLNDVTRYAASVVQVNAGRALTLQVGANSSLDQTVGIGVGSFSATALGVDRLVLLNNESGRASLAAVDKALGVVSDQRAALGAVQNRLEHTILNLDTVAENLQDAESRIRDVDMAKEMMNFTKFTILLQSSQAMMAQANAMPQGVLQLLR